MARGVPQPQFDFRGPDGWQRTLLMGLFVIYVVELIIDRSFPELQLQSLLGWGAWSGWNALEAPWQPLTRFMVQGPNFLSVVIQLVVLYLALPMLNDIIGERTVARAFLAGAVGGTVVPFVADLAPLPLSDGVLLGWGALVWVPFVLLGILRPNATVYLVIFPIEARYILWGSLGLSILMAIGYGSVTSVEPLGVWLGTFGWWNLLGPGARRPERPREDKSVMRQRSQFQVIEGGRSDDDVVH